MDKLKLRTSDFTDENIKRIAELFPNCVTEDRDAKGNITKSIDFDLLRQELSKNIVEGPQERYQLNWPGKREALLTANAPIAKTLRPCREESVDFDTTQNLFIEGDNLDALKLMQETYLGKIKMIYIDPPYNTGNDFIYEDDFAETTEEFFKKSNQKDEEGNRLVANTESNGRFHSDWLSMMYPRLKLARNLLKEDGVIFISIDDNEVGNLKKMCNEIFGEENFLTQFVVVSAPAGTQSSVNVAQQHSYCLAFKKSNKFTTFKIKLSEEKMIKKYNEKDASGSYYIERLWKRGVGGKKEDVPSLHFPVYYNEKTNKIFIDDEAKDEKSLIKIIPYQTKGVLGRWTWSKDKMKKEKDKLIIKKVAGEYKLHKKKYANEEEGYLPYSIIGADIARTELESIETKEIMNAKIFDYPKYSKFVEYFLKFCTLKNDIILDFFAGAATTAHAVMNLNVEDGSARKFIMVQLHEPCNENSEAFKAGYKTIADIGKERIRRAGKKIKEENASRGTARRAPTLDTGFRVLKVDTSNMQEVYYNPDAYSQDTLFKMADNIKPDRSDEDLLFQVLLDWGVDLCLPIVKEKISGNDVFFVSKNALAACFTRKGEITEDFCKELAKREPLRVVFRDSGFKDDSMKINVEQIFKLMSPHTEVKTI